MSIKLYNDPASQPGRAIKSLLVAGKVDHQEQYVSLLENAHKSAEVVALNPAGQIPFITVDGKVQVESASILRYLACKFPSLHQYYPDDLDQRQKIDAALDYNGCVLRPAFLLKIGPHCLKAFNKQEAFTQPQLNMIEMSKVRIPMMLNGFEQRLKTWGGKFACGDEPSIADFQLFAEFVDMLYLGESWESFERISAWYDACRQLPGIKEVHDDFEASTLQPFKSAVMDI